MYVHPASLSMFKKKVNYDADTYSRPKLLGNDIDVYLKPLMGELLQL